jgi:hypothetical protein
VKKYLFIAKVVVLILVVALCFESCLTQSGVPTNFQEKLAYQQQIMYAIEAGLADNQKYIDISRFRCDKDTLDGVITMISFDAPVYSLYLLRCQTAFNLDLSVKYILPTYSYDAQVQFIEGEIEKILAKVDSELTELEKVIWINNYICNNYDYDSTHTERTVYGMLCFNKGVCSAYVQLFKLLADAMNIDSSFVISYEMRHAWNLVCIDGDWYNIDVTWNDQNLIRCYILSDSMMNYFHGNKYDTEKFIQFIDCTNTRFDGIDLANKEDVRMSLDDLEVSIESV